MEEIDKIKKEIREIQKAKRNSLTNLEIQEKSGIIINKIIKSSYYKKSEIIFTYLEMGSEVKTSELIKFALKDGKRVCLPISIKKSREMFFAEIESLDNIKKGAFGTMIPESTISVRSTDKTLIIVPGLSYNENKYRLGYGGGYYDTFISNNEYLKTIGIFFELQNLSSLPVGKYDKRLDLIFTEAREII